MHMCLKKKETCDRIKDGGNVGRQKARSELVYGSWKDSLMNTEWKNKWIDWKAISRVVSSERVPWPSCQVAIIISGLEERVNCCGWQGEGNLRLVALTF